MKVFWKIRFWFRALHQGWKSSKREQLGSRVVYQGKEYVISNWAGSDFPSLTGPDFVLYANRDEITNVGGVREWLYRFRFGYRFYVDNWMNTDINMKMGKYDT